MRIDREIGFSVGASGGDRFTAVLIFLTLLSIKVVLYLPCLIIRLGIRALWVALRTHPFICMAVLIGVALLGATGKHPDPGAPIQASRPIGGSTLSDLEFLGLQDATVVPDNVMGTHNLIARATVSNASDGTDTSDVYLACVGVHKAEADPQDDFEAGRPFIAVFEREAYEDDKPYAHSTMTISFAPISFGLGHDNAPLYHEADQDSVLSHCALAKDREAAYAKGVSKLGYSTNSSVTPDPIPVANTQFEQTSDALTNAQVGNAPVASQSVASPVIGPADVVQPAVLPESQAPAPVGLEALHLASLTTPGLETDIRTHNRVARAMIVNSGATGYHPPLFLACKAHFDDLVSGDRGYVALFVRAQVDQDKPYAGPGQVVAFTPLDAGLSPDEAPLFRSADQGTRLTQCALGVSMSDAYNAEVAMLNTPSN